MKIIQWILIALIFFSPYKANASRDSDSYDGNIFPIYAGNGAIVPPQTTLQESLKNKRVAVLFFYLDDSSDSKAVKYIGNLFVTFLTKVVGKAIGLVGKGILQGLGRSSSK